MKLAPLPTALKSQSVTETAQRFLISAHEAADEIWATLEVLRQGRKAEGSDIRGRLVMNEEDQLRAAIVFTGAGLDSTLKRLIQDALPALLAFNEQAQRKFEEFAAARVSAAETVDPKAIARYLTVSDPRSRLIDDYVFKLTGSSLQSEQQVDTVASALGIADKSVRKAIPDLKPLFIARNEISHELDLQRLEKPGDRTRRSRPMSGTKKICDAGFGTGQGVVNAVNAILAAESGA
jgi:hypothetical protein